MLRCFVARKMAALVCLHDRSLIAGGVPMWRFRFLSSPPTSISLGDSLKCVVGITDEFGTEINYETVSSILDQQNINIRCEIHGIVDREDENNNSNHPVEKRVSMLCGQRSVVTSDVPSKRPLRCRWVFHLKIPLKKQDEDDSDEPISSLEVRVLGESCNGEKFDPFLVFPVVSSPIKLVESPHANSLFGSHHFRCFQFPYHQPARTQVERFISQDDNSSENNPIDHQNMFEVSIREEFGANLGAHVWNSGIVLSEFLCRHFEDYLGTHPIFHQKPNQDISLSIRENGRRVLELGSGCGLTGIVVSHLLEKCNGRGGASGVMNEVYFTDLANNLPLIEMNIHKNFGTTTDTKQQQQHVRHVVTSLDWDKFSQKSQQQEQLQEKARSSSLQEETKPEQAVDSNAAPQACPIRNMSFDLIIAADILYNIDHVDPLLNLLDHFANNSAPSPPVLIALSHRNHGPVISEAMLKQADTVTSHPFFRQAAEVASSKIGEEEIEGRRSRNWEIKSVYMKANVEILEMTRA
jgi:predicted nicotinamide N-methyase